MYRNFFKRILDFCCALAAIVCLSPVLVALTVLGAIKMGGNPFFTQPRPGKDERIFRLVKFPYRVTLGVRSMSRAHTSLFYADFA